MTWILDNATLVGLLFFFTVFVAVLIRTFSPGMKQRIEAHARIPLEDSHDGA